MPVPIGRPYRPRIGLNGARPIAERWQEAVDLLARVAPDTPFLAQISEHNLDALHDLIAEKQKAKAPPQPDAATRDAMNELYEFEKQFNSCSLEIKAAQGWLQHARNDWRHKLLGHITPECFTSVGLFPTAVGEGPKFSNAYEGRRAVQEMLPRLQWVRAICAQINEARAFEKLPPADQSFALMRAFVAKRAESEARITALESYCAALEARIGRLERGNKPKKSKSRPTSSTRSATIRSK